MKKPKLSAIDLDSMTFIVAYNQAVKAGNLTDAQAVKDHVKRFIDTLLVRTDAEKYVLIHQSAKHSNFRKYYYSDYKAKRQGEMPDFLKLWQTTILDTYNGLNATKVNGIESDDALSILYYTLYHEYDITLIHNDKDMHQIPCKHWNLNKKVEEAFSIINKKEAVINWATQMLVGDYSTDNILGCALILL